MIRPGSLSLHDQAGLIGKVAVVWSLVVLLIGLLVLDGISIALATFHLSNTAQAAASTAATSFRNQRDAGKACEAAAGALIGDGVPVPGSDKWCRIDTSSGQATIALRTTASSIVLGRVSFTQDLTEVNVRESAEPAL